VGNALAERYEKLEFAENLREIMLLADLANQYIDGKKPWVLIKDAEKREETHAICTTALNLFRQLMIYLKPVLPNMAGQVETFLNIAPLQWPDKDKPLLAQKINLFVPLATRLTEAHIASLQQAAAAIIA
jgi:methionyl-tRNA synthetase